MANARAHVYVSGRGQGVFFRSYALSQARALGVNGWVRNLFDGRVEALFEGEEKAVQRMVAWCQQGSPEAYVTDVEVDYQPYAGEFLGFQVRY